MQRRWPCRIPSCTGPAVTPGPAESANGSAATGSRSDPTADGGPHGGLDGVAFSWMLSCVHRALWPSITARCCRLLQNADGLLGWGFRGLVISEAQFPRRPLLGDSVNRGTLPTTSARKHLRVVRIDKTVTTVCWV